MQGKIIETQSVWFIKEKKLKVYGGKRIKTYKVKPMMHWYGYGIGYDTGTGTGIQHFLKNLGYDMWG